MTVITGHLTAKNDVISQGKEYKKVSLLWQLLNSSSHYQT